MVSAHCALYLSLRCFYLDDYLLRNHPTFDVPRPKDILVMKNGIISRHHFENTIGIQLGFKQVGKEEKQRINKAYEEWKKQNRE